MGKRPKLVQVLQKQTDTVILFFLLIICFLCSPDLCVGYVPIDQLYQLNQVIQEAARREQNLENKLSNLQILVDQANKSANLAWQVNIVIFKYSD